MTVETERFQGVITSEAELREVLGHPAQGAVAKAIDRIDEHFAGFIARSPFVLLGTSDAAGHQDVSPKGDPAGFVQVLDEHTLAIPDRPGNRRGDSFSNLLENPNIALYFMVPGVRETLRVQGTALIVSDQALRESMAIKGRVPELAIVVDVHDAFMHCAKCVVRSDLWNTEAWPDPEAVPNLAAALVDQLKLPVSKEQIVEDLDRNAREQLY